MILCLISVGGIYNSEMDFHIKQYVENGWDVIILTNTPELFSQYKTIYYPYKVFSYFFKLLFPLQIMEKEKQDVLYIDIKNLGEISQRIIEEFKGSDSFLYLDHWQKLDHYNQITGQYYFVPWVKMTDHQIKLLEPLHEYFDEINFDSSELVTIWERMMYFPFFDNVSEILYELEKIKPLFEYMSIIDDGDYSQKGIGYGEGLALSYIFTIFNIPMKKFKEIGY
jgi:hypothetical protein